MDGQPFVVKIGRRKPDSSLQREVERISGRLVQIIHRKYTGHIVQPEDRIHVEYGEAAAVVFSGEQVLDGLVFYSQAHPAPKNWSLRHHYPQVKLGNYEMGGLDGLGVGDKPLSERAKLLKTAMTAPARRTPTLEDCGRMGNKTIVREQSGTLTGRAPVQPQNIDRLAPEAQTVREIAAQEHKAMGALTIAIIPKKPGSPARGRITPGEDWNYQGYEATAPELDRLADQFHKAAEAVRLANRPPVRRIGEY